MPLNIAKLVTEIRKITDSAYSGFEGFPRTDADTADRWARAFDAYMRQISNPAPGLQTELGHRGAREAMRVALLGMSITSGAAILRFPLGFKAYVVAFAALTAPYVSTPPPTNFVMPSLPIAPPPSGLSAATVIATAVDLWVRTGTASIPPAPPVFWT